MLTDNRTNQSNSQGGYMQPVFLREKATLSMCRAVVFHPLSSKETN